MSEVSGGITHWLEQKRRTDRASAAVISVLALGSGAVVFLSVSLLIYGVLSLLGGYVDSVVWLWLVAFGLTAWFFVRSMKGMQHRLDLVMDPMGFWIIKDICSIGPRLILEGMRQVRCCGQLGELNVAACARALAYLAGQNAAVTWENLVRHCSQLPQEQLREQLSLLDGVLFLGEDGCRVTLMEPFRLRLRLILEREPRGRERQEPDRPSPEPPLQGILVNDPERLSAYEILGLSPSASLMEIKAAYRKRVKECHPDLFAGMDQQAKVLAERWTRALNAAYATLNPRRPDARLREGRRPRAGGQR
jgi:hypothetical protein